MRVLAACAAPPILQYFLLNTTLLSLFLFILLLRLRPDNLVKPFTENFCTPWIELRETKCLDHPCEIVLFQNTFAASFCRATPWTPVMRELPLALPLRPWGIAHFSLQKRHQLRRARVRRHTVFDHISPLAEHSADVLVPPRRQTPAQCGLFRSHLLVICAAKLRHTAAAAREHRRVLAPRLPTPGASVASPLHAP
jgi:hypothetical protein